MTPYPNIPDASRKKRSDLHTGYEMNDPSAMANAAARKPVIRLDVHLSLSSADSMVEILRGISLSIDAGQTVGV